MTAQDKQALLTNLNNTFNETVKYIQFRFNEVATQINTIPTDLPTPEPKEQVKT
jgi:hypothetical protein